MGLSFILSNHISMVVIVIANCTFIKKIYSMYISSHKWSTTYRVLKSHRRKMGVVYMWSSKQCVLPVITTMTLWQLMHLGTWCNRSHVPNSMSCHKAIVVINRREHCFHDYIYNICMYNVSLYLSISLSICLYIYICMHFCMYVYRVTAF